MAIGLGHNYLVRVLKYHSGDLESCIKFMQECAPINSLQWFELRPSVHIEKGKPVKLDTYHCQLVCDAHYDR